MSERKAFLVVFAVVLLVCAGLVNLGRLHKEQQLTLATRDLLKNRAIWLASEISNYSFSIVPHGLNHTQPMQVVVRNGAVLSASLFCPPPNSQACCREWEASRKDIAGPERLRQDANTIPQLFDRVSMFRNDPDAQVVAEFDPTYGFPKRFSFDNPKSDDDEYGFEISEFTVIE